MPQVSIFIQRLAAFKLKQESQFNAWHQHLITAETSFDLDKKIALEKTKLRKSVRKMLEVLKIR